jgi:hypothetical protein
VSAVDESFCQVELASIAQVFGQRFEDLLKHPFVDPLLVATMARLVRRISARQIDPLRSGAKETHA